MLSNSKHSCQKYVFTSIVANNAGNKSRKLREYQRHTTTPSLAQCKANMQGLFIELLRVHPDMHQVNFFIQESGPYLNMSNEDDHQKKTALMLAAEYGHKSIVDALIAKKAALDLQDKDDMTGIDACC